MPGALCVFEGMLYQLDRRADVKFYCQIYLATTKDAIATTLNYDNEEEAVAEAKEKIISYQSMGSEYPYVKRYSLVLSQHQAITNTRRPISSPCANHDYILKPHERRRSRETKKLVDNLMQTTLGSCRGSPDRLDGKSYCRIYLHGIPGAIASTDDFNTEE